MSAKLLIFEFNKLLTALEVHRALEPMEVEVAPVPRKHYNKTLEDILDPWSEIYDDEAEPDDYTGDPLGGQMAVLCDVNDKLDEVLSALPLSQPLIFRAGEALRADIESELAAMLTEYADGALPLAASRLCRLLLVIASAPNGYTSAPFPDPRIARIVRYINEHYSEINDIGEIAERFFISKYPLCRTFNENLGLPLVSYLNTLKVRAAAELMQNEKMNLTEIATRSGFNSSSYFCKVFKAEKGVSPTVYRKNLRGK